MMISLAALKAVVPTDGLEHTIRKLTLEAGEQLMRFFISGEIEDWYRFLSLHEEAQIYEDEITERIRIMTGVDFGQSEKRGGGWWDD